MKKRITMLTIFLLLTMLIILTTILNPIKASTLTGETVTGKAASGPTDVSVFILPATTPALSIISPQNETYLTNESLLLNYSVSNEDTVLYNLDNLENTTITSSITFNTSQGSHVLYLYANNSGGMTARNVRFFINSTRFIILYDEYKGLEKGSSIDFITYSYTDIQNLSNIILENTQSGKILFNQPVNLTDDEDTGDNVLDLDTNTNISLKRIEINSVALPNFNIPATLWFYNLSLSNPRILKDGSVCSSSICTIESYTGGTLKTLKFNVTGFTVYTVVETPAEEVEEEAPSPGGGGIAVKRDFLVDQAVIKVLLKKGESFKTRVNIKNTENTAQAFQLSLSQSLEGLVSFSDKSFTLQPGKEKTVYLDFFSDEETKPDVYTGNLKIKTLYKTKEIPIIYNLETKMLLFKITLDLPAAYKEVFPGEDLFFQVTLFGLGEFGKTNVTIKYIIKDFKGNIILEQDEIIEVETQVSFSRTIKLPPTIKPGNYLAIAQASYSPSLGSSSIMFHVVEKKPGIMKLIRNKYFIIITIIVILILIILSLKYKKIKLENIFKPKTSRKISKRKILPSIALRIKDRFERQLEALEKAYSSKYISKESYLKGKERIRKASK